MNGKRERGNEWAAEAENMVRDLWVQQYRDRDPDPRWSVLSPASVDLEDSDLDEEERVIRLKRKLGGRSQSFTPPADELDRWLLSIQESELSPKADPVRYWMERRFEHPRLAKMAFDVLNVPPMAAECERTFSAAGSIVTIRRTRLGTDVISAAQTIRSWIKAGLMEDYDGIALRSTEIEALEDELGQQVDEGDGGGWSDDGVEGL